MTYDAEELKQYPEIMNKEQLRKVCHISKRTAHYLLQFNLIPHVCTGKKTRCYAIKKRDVIDFMINREINPSRYIVPTSWYKYGNEDVKPYRIRIQPPLPNDPQKTRRYYESKLSGRDRRVRHRGVYRLQPPHGLRVDSLRKAPRPSAAAQVHDPEVLSDRLALHGRAQRDPPQVPPPH